MSTSTEHELTTPGALSSRVLPEVWPWGVARARPQGWLSWARIRTTLESAQRLVTLISGLEAGKGASAGQVQLIKRLKGA